ncbi:hypothetical protein HMPREF1985_01756 [Mitsuokella sp. oral taxon 131 str. W9106]|nr:hypothetical protein HMPREF1985_01756 [Mitsuokella sp. oral taxon 131 str. W9106]
MAFPSFRIRQTGWFCKYGQQRAHLCILGLRYRSSVVYNIRTLLECAREAMGRRTRFSHGAYRVKE